MIGGLVGIQTVFVMLNHTSFVVTLLLIIFFIRNCEGSHLLPSVRLIVLLRDPVERCLSQYFHSYRLGLESLDLESALSAESDRLAGAEEQLVAPGGSHRSYQEHSYMSRSRYEHQLSRFEKYFNIDQFLLLRSEDLFENPIEAWDRILDFLCLHSMPFPLNIPPANWAW